MIGYKQCSKCKSVNQPDVQYCTCGQALTDADMIVPDASGELAMATTRDDDLGDLLGSEPGYLALKTAVVFLKILALLFALLSLVGLLTSDKFSAWFVLFGFASIGLKTFLLWIAGDVIKILLDIRSHQVASQ